MMFMLWTAIVCVIVQPFMRENKRETALKAGSRRSVLPSPSSSPHNTECEQCTQTMPVRMFFFFFFFCSQRLYYVEDRDYCIQRMRGVERGTRYRSWWILSAWLDTFKYCHEGVVRALNEKRQLSIRGIAINLRNIIVQHYVVCGFFHLIL